MVTRVFPSSVQTSSKKLVIYRISLEKIITHIHKRALIIRGAKFRQIIVNCWRNRRLKVAVFAGRAAAILATGFYCCETGQCVGDKRAAAVRGMRTGVDGIRTDSAYTQTSYASDSYSFLC